MAYIKGVLAPETLLDSPPLVMYLKPAKINHDGDNTNRPRQPVYDLLSKVPTPVVP